MLTHLMQLGGAADRLASHPLNVSMIPLDISDSVIKREMPIMNMPQVLLEPLNYELFVGLCPEIYRFWYELCEISCARSPQSEQLDLSDSGENDAALFDISSRIDAWQPSISPSLLRELTSAEATHLQTQLRVSKLSMKLFVHRLLFPFGQEDSAAQVLATAVMSDLDLATAIAGVPPTLLTLSFVIAACDIPPEEREQVLNRVPLHVDGISPEVEVWTKNFLMTMWHRRDTNPGSKWIDVMDELPQFCVNRVGGSKRRTTV